MKIAELIILAENKLASLNQSVATATTKGDAAALPALEAEIIETQDTLAVVRSQGAA